MVGKLYVGAEGRAKQCAQGWFCHVWESKTGVLDWGSDDIIVLGCGV